ncbi:MAG: cytochrome-c peroxidase [Bacteroidia bacterium]
MPLSQSFEPGRMLTRNAPTLVRFRSSAKLFHDGRAFTFEDQAGQVMSNPLEMHNDFSAVAIKLRRSDEYKKLFTRSIQRQ